MNNSQSQTLSNKFNTLLSEYQSTYSDFIDVVNSNDNTFITVDNTAFNGANIIKTIPMSNVNSCSTSCSSNTSCTGATFTSTNNCVLSSGNGNIINTANSSAIVKKALFYTYQLQKINQELMNLNQEINNNVEPTYNTYQTNLDKIKVREKAIKQNYLVLTQDRENIAKLVREFETLDSVQENGDIKATMNYYNYIVLVFIAILLLFLLLRFSIPNQQNGGSNTFFKKMFGNSN